MSIGHVAALMRFPVKSLGGERIDDITFGRRGPRGDRLWAIRDLERDVTVSARRIPALLAATARYPSPVDADAGPGNVPEVEITFPDGTVLSSREDAVHAKLSELAGRDVRLTSLPPADDTSLHKLSRQERSGTSLASLRKDFGIADDEKLPDVSMLRMSDLATFARYSTPPGMFVDLAPVHVLTQTSVDAIGAEIGAELDVRRFRPNVLLALDNPDDDLPESHWTGGYLTVGGVGLDVLMPTIRCVVPSRAQPGFDVDRRITKAVAVKAQRCLGVYCAVRSEGAVRVGDDVSVRMQKRGPLSAAAEATRRFALKSLTGAANRLPRRAAN
jgi:uncharacterized protein YcbX